MKVINVTLRRNYKKYFTNIFLCYVTMLFNFCGLQVPTTPAEQRYFYIFQYVQPTSEAQSTFHLMGTRDFFFRKKTVGV
jgi:hypothetical protein